VCDGELWLSFYGQRSWSPVTPVSLGILLINFGEPDEPTPEKVSAYLERIFLQNAALEGHTDDAAVARSRQLARDRAPALLEEYRTIGGSPLNAQAEAQAGALRAEMARRGDDARIYSAYQFTDPSIAQAVTQARADGVDTLLAFPGYPLCGHSTTVEAINAVRRALDAERWQPRFVSIAGWHWHPAYEALWTGHISRFTALHALDLTSADTLLYFSVHGTPLKYLRDGNRYDRYVFEHCAAIALAVGADRYGVGFQNHTNRRVAWTQPDNEERIRDAIERRLVVVPISFLREQSETLAELDHGLRAFAQALGKEFHRVPVPHDDVALAPLMADLIAEALADAPGADRALSRCRCRPDDGTWCTNGARELPPSPFAPAA